MSLINDALKKAQRQRSTDSAPPLPSAAAANPPPGKVAKRAKPLTFQSQVVRMAATVLGLGLLLIGGVLYWQWKSYSSEPLALSAPKSPAKVAMQPAAPAPSAATALEPAKEPGPGAVAATFAVPTVSSPAVASAETAEPVPAAPTGRARPDPKILAYIDTLRITGIRAAGGDSKVLMNDRVFRVNDVVDHMLGLKLTGVAAEALTFEDERGVVYTRNF
ncbi:MAG: hypothetical protein HY302_14770 [Opitutae bacterium]|nr:hypothetical protein [Opitutae bacterium]